MSDPDHSDSIITSKAMTLGDFLRIVQHPAFRLGFLDARAGRPLEHDRVMQRIVAETPAGALKRLGWQASSRQPDLFGIKRAQTQGADRAVETAQYRYEEGRTVFL